MKSKKITETQRMNIRRSRCDNCGFRLPYNTNKPSGCMFNIRDIFDMEENIKAQCEMYVPDTLLEAHLKEILATMSKVEGLKQKSGGVCTVDELINREKNKLQNMLDTEIQRELVKSAVNVSGFEHDICECLPCKVGDKVYDCNLRPYIVKTICIHENGRMEIIGKPTLRDDELEITCTWNRDCIGKAIFLTYEAAQQALKERNTP